MFGLEGDLEALDIVVAAAEVGDDDVAVVCYGETGVGVVGAADGVDVGDDDGWIRGQCDSRRPRAPKNSQKTDLK